jgi:hypothetical protein
LSFSNETKKKLNPTNEMPMEKIEGQMGKVAH